MRILRRQSLLAFGLSLFCTFTAASPLDFDTKSHLAVPGDFNGDGRMDVLMQPLVGDGKGAIILQDGTGQLSVLSQGWDTGYLGLDWSTKQSTLTTADLNADGQDDVLMQPVKAGGTAAVLITDPTIQLLQISQLLPSGYLNLDWSSETHHAVAGDFDGDRHKELFMQATQPGGLGAIVHADQMGNIVAITQTFADGYLGRHWNSKEETLYVGDFNGDGRQDLLVQSRGTVAGESAYALLLADGNGQFTRISQTWNLKDLGANWNPSTHKLLIQDANHDGIMDIVLQSTASGGTNYLFEGDAQGLFMQPTVHWTGNKSASDALTAANSGKTSATKTTSTGIKVGSIGGITAHTISGPTDPEPNPIPIHGGSQAQGSGQIMTVTAAGALQGSGGVSGGTATYSIPISVPPGIAGMQPSISLNYSSRGGNGEMGMGWSVSAGSQIHRCPATQAMDGYSSGVTYYSNPTSHVTADRLCLDGQHLIYTGGGNGYGADGATYRTELDGFALITETGNISDGTSSFEVQEKNGRVLHYGYASNGSGANSVFTPFGAGHPLAWGLGKEVDTYGNNIIYYYSTFGAGEYLLTSINYTGSAAAVGNREVDFSYSSRTDVSTQYLAGGLTTQSQVLSSISVSDNGTPIRIYSAEYASSGATARSLLAGVQECGFTGSTESCLPETTFSWQNPSRYFMQPVAYNLDIDGSHAPDYDATALSNQPSVTAAGDFNGDGRRDLLYSRPGFHSQVLFVDDSGNSSNVDVDTTSMFAGAIFAAVDVDGDGAADLVGPISNGDLAYSTFTGTPAAPSFSNPNHNDLGIPFSYGSGTTAIVAVEDVDGDGKPDVIAYVPDTTTPGTYDLMYYQNTSTGGSVSFAAPVTKWTSSTNYIIKPAGDLDGNGLPDFSVYIASQLEGFIFTRRSSNSLTFSYVTAAGMGLDRNVLDINNFNMQVDINGDGLPDYIFDCWGTTDICYQLNTGGQFGPVVDTGVTDPNILDSTISSANLVADVNNDGVQHVLYPSQMIATYCVLEEEEMEGVEQKNDVCINSSSHPLPPSQDFSIYRYGELAFVPQVDATQPSGYKYMPVTDLTGIVAQAHLTVAGDLYGNGMTAIISPFTKWFAGGEFSIVSGGSQSYSNCPNPYPCGFQAVVNQMSTAAAYKNAAPDMMLSATDGFGRQEQWDYYPLSSSKQFNSVALYYSPGTISQGIVGQGYAGDDYFYFASSMYVVGDHSASDGVGGMNTHDFHYAQAIYNNQGRGFQGFRTVVDDDMTSGARTVQVYHQRFPLSGELQQSWVKPLTSAFDLTSPEADISSDLTHPVDTTVIDYVNDGWGCIQGNQTTMNVDGINCGGATMDAHTYVPVLLNSTETHYDVMSHDQLSQTNTQYCTVASGACSGFGYDLYANSLGSVSTTVDPYGTYTTSVSDSYPSPDPVNWWINKLTQKVSTTTVAYVGSAPIGSVIRTTGYDYYGDGSRSLNHVNAQEDGQAANGSTTHYTYSGGNVTSVAVTGGTGLGAISRTTATTYSVGADAGYFVQTVTDPMNLTTTYAMDPRFGSPTSVTAPDGAQTVSTYDAFGRKVTSQLTAQSVTLPVQTISYINPASGDTTCNGTSAASQYYVLVNQTGYPSHYACYDMFNRAIRTAHENLSDASDLVVQSTYYDNHGRVTKFTDPHFSSASWIWNTNQYDDTNILGRLSSKTDAKGIVTSYTYTDLVTDILTTPPDSAPRQDEEVKNSLGKLMTVTNAVGDLQHAATSYQYDADGNPVTIIAADTTQITAVFDVLGHKLSVTDPDQGTTQYVYDVAGDLISQTDAKSQVLTMVYDNDGRMTSKSSSIGTEPPVAWTYDSGTNCSHGAGKLCAVTVGGVTGYSETYAYTIFGMVKSDIETIGGTAYETDTDYDSDGRVALVTYPATAVTDQAPVANAGATQYVLPGATVTLNGSATDTDGPDALDYQWSQTVGPTVSLSSASVANPSFAVGTALGTTYSFQLIADDGLLTNSANVNVVVPSAPAAPATPTDDGDTNHDGVYTVSWQAVSVTGTNIVYHLEEATGTASAPTGSWSECYVGSTASASINHSGNSFYYYWYRVRAEDQISGHSVGYSDYSSTDSIHVVVKPGSPSTISPGTGTSTTGTYNISWGTATGGVVTADVYYQLYQSTSSTLSGASQVYSGTARSQSITNSIGDYYYEVRACNTNTSVTECSAFTLKAHEIVESTSPPPGGPGGPTQPQIREPITPIPPPVTSVGTVGALAPVTPILPQLQSGKQRIGIEAVAQTALMAHARSVRTVRSAANKLSISADQNALGYVRPKFAPPVYQAWADAKVQNATTAAQVVRFSVQYLYSGNGYLEKLADGTNPNRVYWSANYSAEGSPTQFNSNETAADRGMNAYGQVTDVVFGNGATSVATHYGYDETTDYLDSINSNNGATVYQNLAYTWQTIGNLATRASNGTSGIPSVLSEGFTYDLHNRLLSSTITNSSGIQPTVTYGYDSVGDIKCRSDLNGGTCSSASINYGYGSSAGPHAVTSIAGTINGVSNPTYTYDADGNRTGGAGTAVNWNSDNLPTSIIQSGSNSSTFSYAPDKHRYMQVAMNGGVQETTIYAGGMEIFTSGGVTKYRYTLSAYGRPVFLDELSNTSVGAPKEGQSYLLTDHLGSVDTVIDASGVTAPAPQSFDTFGHHRDPNTWVAISGNGITITKHGFTHHEHMDNVGLIHMNGRVYDPTVGRFLSVDPMFQAPTNSQSVNPYSYVMNNPLSLTDPSGYESTCQVSTSDSTGGSQDCSSVSTSSLKDGETLHAKVSTTDVGSHITSHASFDIAVKGDINGNGGGGGGVQSLGYSSGSTAPNGAPSKQQSAQSNASDNQSAEQGTTGTKVSGNSGQQQTSDTPSVTAPLNAGDSRHFTDGEIKMAQSIFGNSIDYNQPLVNLDKAYFFQPSGTAMTPDGNMYFNPAGDLYKDDFSKADIGSQGLFMHEMVHIWQNQQGINVRTAMFNRTYFYLPLTPGKPFSAYGLEQQGDIVRDYFFLRSGYKLPYSPDQLKGIQVPTVADYEKILPFQH